MSEKYAVCGVRVWQEPGGPERSDFTLIRCDSLEAVIREALGMKSGSIFIVEKEIEITKEVKEALYDWRGLDVANKNMETSKERLKNLSQGTKTELLKLGIS